RRARRAPRSAAAVRPRPDATAPPRRGSGAPGHTRPPPTPAPRPQRRDPSRRARTRGRSRARRGRSPGPASARCDRVVPRGRAGVSPGKPWQAIYRVASVGPVYRRGVPWRRHLRLPASIAHPVRLLPLAFLSLIAVGTMLLMLPVAREGEGGTDLMTALFTSASASTITGLATVDTGGYWSPVGQAIIAVLAELG